VFLLPALGFLLIFESCYRERCEPWARYPLTRHGNPNAVSTCLAPVLADPGGYGGIPADDQDVGFALRCALRLIGSPQVNLHAWKQPRQPHLSD